MDYEQWMKRAELAIETEIQPGKKFEVKHLFPGHEWEDLPKGDRTSFGRHFSDAVKEGRLTNVVRCENGKSHHNQYIKKEGK